MPVKVYFDLLSQPSRAVLIFLKVNKIQHVECPVALTKGEHFTEEYAKINPMKKAPAIDDDGFKLTESVSIMKYLSIKYAVPSHWYPSNVERRARVDEYLDWHQYNTRPFGAMLFQHQLLIPWMKGHDPDPKKVDHFKHQMVKVLDTMEAVFLNNQNFLAGDEMSIADLAAACELTQPAIAGFDLFSQRPKLRAWMDRVRSQTNPHFDEAHSEARKWREELAPKYPIAGSSKL